MARKLACPISAIVKPAKAPPRRTRPTATARYIHNVGLSGGIGGSSSSLRDVKGAPASGAAPRSGKLVVAKMKSLTPERSNGRVRAYPLVV